MYEQCDPSYKAKGGCIVKGIRFNAEQVGWGEDTL